QLLQAQVVRHQHAMAPGVCPDRRGLAVVQPAPLHAYLFAGADDALLRAGQWPRGDRRLQHDQFGGIAVTAYQKARAQRAQATLGRVDDEWAWVALGGLHQDLAAMQEQTPL